MRIIINESQFINLFEAATLNDIYTKYYSKIPQDIFNQIISADPTYNSNKPDKMGKYGKWLLQLYINRRLKIEDLYKATNYLKCFIEYYNVIQDKDINKIKSLQELYDVVRPYLDGNAATSKSDEVRKIKEGAEKVYEDERWLVIVPHTKEASCYYGKGTQWCTAADKSNNMFDQYNDDGPLYINIDKLNNRKYQFHFETNSFMDENDNEIDGPIAKTCELSDGLCNWYRENVDGVNMLFEISFDFFYSEDSNIMYSLIQDEYDETVYRLYDRTNHDVICGGLVCNGGLDEMKKWYRLLYNRNYCIIPNTKGLYTLLVIDDGSLYSMSSNAVNVSLINNDYGGYDESDLLFFDITYNDNQRCILQNNGYHLYVCKDASMIKYIEFISYDVIEITKTNGFSDILNWNYEQVFYDLKDVEIDYDEDDTLYAYNQYGQKVKINMYDSSEEVVEDEDNE